MKRLLLAALAAISTHAAAAFNPLPPSQIDYLTANFSGVWSLYNTDAPMTVTIDHSAGYFTLMLDDTEAQDAKVIDVDAARNIITVTFTNTDGLGDELTLHRDAVGDLWFNLGTTRFPLQFTRRITDRDRDRIDCLTGPVAYRNLEAGDLNCDKLGY